MSAIARNRDENAWTELVNHVVDDPDNQAARLALADWLEEHGREGYDLLRSKGELIWRDNWKVGIVSWRVTVPPGTSDPAPEFELRSGPCDGRRKCDDCGNKPRKSVKEDGVVAIFVTGRGWLCPLCRVGNGPKRFTKEEEERMERNIKRCLLPPGFVRRPFAVREHEELGRKIAETVEWLRKLSRELGKRYGKSIFLGPSWYASDAERLLLNLAKSISAEWECDLDFEGVSQLPPCPYPSDKDALSKGRRKRKE